MHGLNEQKSALSAFEPRKANEKATRRGGVIGDMPEPYLQAENVYLVLSSRPAGAI
ncbi:hypothetical protein FOIG_08778 [Fusarium odoratissimum NRRL 54006]|uniref:Uncharacterized protein n=1 Tax=Fusarium odoratissimum (strain NRRL 54006) TaxID=1089451 RepID=X0KSL5_FUSO5|nr:uncharacterized protein FOIG_08778 [Fusarium odoratissimum NRRL 54006]EXL99759.1 hypothetical protein FOIG_08778 [Fusarium odoratissimum NRRL 54006]